MKNYPKGKPAEVEEVLKALVEADPEIEWKRAAIVARMKELAELGFGSFIEGVKGTKSHLQWVLPPRAVCKAALGEPEELQHLLAGEVGRQDAALDVLHRGKSQWTYEELQELLATLTGLPIERNRILLTIPEVRKILAEGQGVSTEDVIVRIAVGPSGEDRSAVQET